MAKPIRIMPNRRTLLIQILFSAVMLALCIFLIFTLHVLDSAVWRFMGLVIAVLGPPLFLIALAYLIRKYFAKVPVVVVDEEGIQVNTGVFYSTSAKWSEITQLGLVEFMRRKYIVAMVKDPSVQVELSRGMERRSIAAYVKRFGTPVVINESALDVSGEEFLKEIQEISREVLAKDRDRSENP